MKKLSIVILNHNTKDLLLDCLRSLSMVRKELEFEVIVVDNGSDDDSVVEVRDKYPWVDVMETGRNLGFAKGNNYSRKKVIGEYVLFLNSDTLVSANTLKKTVQFLDEKKGVGAVTCKIVLPNGSLDKDARRSFPTPWVAVSHFSGLDRIFPKSKLFSKYWYGGFSSEKTMEVDVLQGAYFLVRRKILDNVGWFDEDYFLDGEDIDLCWKIKEFGWRIYYLPKVSITHIKGATKGKVRSFGRVTKDERIRYVNSGVDSMAIFYKKRLWRRYPLPLNYLVIFAIYLLKSLRYLKAFFS